MYDMRHDWGGDLAVSGTGDIAILSCSDVTNQRVYRRLLTNPGDYIWHQDYGAGLAQFVGAPTNTPLIEAVVRNQLEQEASVAQSPLPRVNAEIADSANGYVLVNLSFTEAASSKTVQLLLPIGA